MTLYVSDTCPNCHVLYDSPLIAGVPIANISRDPKAHHDLVAAGSRAVPTLVVGTNVIVGPRPILDYLARARGAR